MIKLIHGADLHLDSPFSGLTPEQAAARRQEQRELLDRLARLAREREADLLLLSGDLLDSRRTYRETAQALARSLGSLPCPVFLAPGNHDFYGPQSLYAALDWPENVHIFTSGSVRRAELPGLDCVVYGRAFLGPREDRSPLEGFRAERDGRVQLMAVHGEVDGRGEYGPISREDIACSGLDYLALGHIHQTSGLQREGAPSGPIPAARRAGALTSWETRASSMWRRSPGAAGRSSSPCAAGGIRSCPWM